MKVLHLIYTHGIAGAEKYLLDLLPGIKEHGIAAEVICVCPPAHEKKVQVYCDMLIAKGIPTQLLASSRINVFKVAQKINRYCRLHQISCIHSHLFNSDVLAVFLKIFYNKKIVLLSTKHGYQESYFVKNPDRVGKIRYNFYYFITKYIISKIDHNITISKATSDLYFALKLTQNKMPFVHHGIAVDGKIIKENGVIYKKASPQLIIAGRLTAIKGHDYLFDAMPVIIKEFPETQLLVLGEGEEKERLRQKAGDLGIQNHISFLGFQSNPYAYIQESDVIIMPSLHEAFGLVYIESFALKTPVVAFDVQACNEIIDNGQTGILVPAKDTTALTNAVLQLLKNPAEQEKLANNAYQKYTSYYNTSRMVKDTAVWYKSININK
ncbi:MAG: glycosyltransferase [Ferruginibacter sp.]